MSKSQKPVFVYLMGQHSSLGMVNMANIVNADNLFQTKILPAADYIVSLELCNHVLF